MYVSVVGKNLGRFVGVGWIQGHPMCVAIVGIGFGSNDPNLVGS